jgi:hypothetical protein
LYNTNTGRIALYQTDLNGGNVRQFGNAVSPGTGSNVEHFVAASYSVGGWTGGNIYVAQGNSVLVYSTVRLTVSRVDATALWTSG